MSVRTARHGLSEDRGHHASAFPSPIEPQVSQRPSDMRPAPRHAPMKAGRADPLGTSGIRELAGQRLFVAGSKIATHSTCDVMGNMSIENSFRRTRETAEGSRVPDPGENPAI